MPDIKLDMKLEIGGVLAADLDLTKRKVLSDYKGRSEFDIDKLAAMLADGIRSLPIVYTAFDGDHQTLSPLMRRVVLENNRVPANPDSVLGYKETVEARLTKRGVLLDDLAVLRGCDELWVFTDIGPDLNGVPTLAEGVLVELMYFLKRRPPGRVFFVSCHEVLSGEKAVLHQFKGSYEELQSVLADNQRKEILDLANSGTRIDTEIPLLVYHIYDPLDFKYTKFLRARAYTEDERAKTAPLIPGLAVEIGDGGEGLVGLGTVVAAWARLIKLAGEAWLLPPMDGNRSPSIISALLERMWLRTNSGRTLRRRSWSTYPIPKARTTRLWAITAKEREAIGDTRKL
jgi:hypothetical protein